MTECISSDSSLDQWVLAHLNSINVFGTDQFSWGLVLDLRKYQLLLFVIVFFNDLLRISKFYVFALKPLKNQVFNGLVLFNVKRLTKTFKTCFKLILGLKANFFVIKTDLWSLGWIGAFRIVKNMIKMSKGEIFDSEGFCLHEFIGSRVKLNLYWRMNT